MVYSIYIGDARLVKDEGVYFIDVRQVENSGAPFWESNKNYPDISGKTNGRHPSYSGMRRFCENVGLCEMFYDEEIGLLRNHPGVFEITKKHLSMIKACKEIYLNTPPYLEPGWTNGKDPDLARLIWYEYWFEWALNNCKNPAISNG